MNPYLWTNFLLIVHKFDLKKFFFHKKTLRYFYLTRPCYHLSPTLSSWNPALSAVNSGTTSARVRWKPVTHLHLKSVQRRRLLLFFLLPISLGRFLSHLKIYLLARTSGRNRKNSMQKRSLGKTSAPSVVARGTTLALALLLHQRRVSVGDNALSVENAGTISAPVC